MVELFPFRGYRYLLGNKEIVKAVSPPYDIISDDKLKELLGYPYNIAHIIKNENHKKAKKILEDWIQKDIFKKEDKESIYIYGQVFSYGHKTYVRDGIIVLAKVYDYEEKQILPHENIKEEIIEDRLDLLKKTKVDVGLIFSYAEDHARHLLPVVEKHKFEHPLYAFGDVSGIFHRLWKIDNPSEISYIKEIFKEKKLYILDGHHRYEASRRFKKEHGKVMVYITSDKKNLLILDHNRITNEPDKEFPENDITLDYIIEKANKLETIGKKATYFYPKPLSGLVIYKF